jgi:hypothetical protein
MVNQIISTIISFAVTGLLGYLVGALKKHKSKDENQEKALQCLLRSTITSKYFVYTELGSIPNYEKQNIDYMYEQYKAMGGNSYIDGIVKEINELPTTR